ncbi:Ig-like domain-containing protein [Streptomyces sp. NPDC004752]
MSNTSVRSRRWPGALLAVLLALVMGAALPPKAAHAADTTVTITSVHTGDRLPVGTVRISGTYTSAYDLKIFLNGHDTDRVHTLDPENDDTGRWYYDLDTRGYDGTFEIAVQGTSPATRYGVNSPWVQLSVDNPRAAKPAVTVLSPSEGARITGVTPIRLGVRGRNGISAVEVRVNGGPWQRAVADGDGYSYLWEPHPLGNTFASIEARATDVRGNTGYSTSTYVPVGDAQPKPVVRTPQDRAMWLWEESSYNLVHNKGSRRVLQSLADYRPTSASRPVKTLYFGVARDGSTDMLKDLRPRTRDLLSWAHAHGYQVFALIAGGTQPPALGGLDRFRDIAVAELEKVLDYNLSSAPDERFDGLNVDIEPYVLGPEYATESPSYQTQWLDTLQTLIDRRNASGTGLQFGPAMPVWLDTEAVTWHGRTETMAQHFQDMSDYVSLMDYRDHSAAIIQDAATEIAYADEIGKPGSVLIGIETIDLVAVGGDPSWVTFHEEGRTGLETEAAKVDAAYADDPGYGGIAMHHYDSIVDLPSRWGPSAVYPPMPSDSRPPTPVSAPPTAKTVDHSSVDVSFGRSFDDSEVHHYNVYRSTRRDFTPGPATLAGQTHGLRYTDTGLLANTTYYYRVTAVDTSGKAGPASAVTSARTARTTLRPIVVDRLDVTRDATTGVGHVSLQVVDLATGRGLPASVGGRFTESAGQYVMLSTGTDGRAAGDSVPLTAATGAVGFQVHRIVAPGYYWASAYDSSHSTEVNW